MRLLIGGDVCPINRYVDLFTQGSPDEILGPCAPWARSADLFVANLECPIILEPTPIAKTGPVLGTPASSARCLRSLGLHAMGLANNHIMDHGPAGLRSTLQACAAEGIATFGAGPNLAEAMRPLLLEVKGLRVGILGLAEREWSLAGPAAPGANPLDPIQFVRSMKEWRGRMDLLVVLLHGGSEGYPLPSPDLQKTCRFLVEEGANVVACQHSHCVGSYETYQDQLIVYGQGNFIFDHPSHRHPEGLLIALDVATDGTTSYELVPFTQGTGTAGLAALPEAAEAEFRSELESRSRAMARPGYVEDAWEAHCRDRRLPLMNVVLDHGRLLRRLNQHGAILDWRGKDYTRNLLSIVQNETHLEALTTMLRDQLK